MYGENRRGGYGGGEGYGGGYGGGSYHQERSTAPVSVGDELDVRIEAVGEKGDGIARKRGFVLFVPNTKEGDEVHIKVTKVLRKVGFAENMGPAQGKPEVEEQKPKREPSQQGSYAQEATEEPTVDSEDFGEESASPTEEPAEDSDVPPLPEDEGQQ
ncbi:TRAM domain-containing protein [Candidatus Woesearchaeota archaeon]|nr:TRAM domain-containing protein [Candidatus Woesearchaeota archaeon]